MPNRRTHVRAGVPSGAVFAACRACDQLPAYILLEAVGGALGGWAGARLPDGLEPANCWNHRSFCHSWSALISGVRYSYSFLSKWECFCRQKATETAQRLTTCALTGFDRSLFWLQELVWRIAAGLLAGLIAGYASHLILDSETPSCLPAFA
jgi:membrane-bound metal-dependent hydrolase YbcI (DUF457 family)